MCSEVGCLLAVFEGSSSSPPVHPQPKSLSHLRHSLSSTREHLSPCAEIHTIVSTRLYSVEQRTTCRKAMARVWTVIGVMVPGSVCVNESMGHSYQSSSVLSPYLVLHVPLNLYITKKKKSNFRGPSQLGIATVSVNCNLQ